MGAGQTLEVVQLQNAPGAPTYSVPTDGAITEWSHLAESGETEMMKLAVYRLTSANTFLVVGKSGFRPMVANMPNSFPVSPAIQVKAGDRVGLVSAAGSVLSFSTGATAADVFGFKEGDVAPGGSFTIPGANMAPTQRTDISATFDPEEKITSAIATPTKFAPIKGGPAEAPVAASSAAQGTVFRFTLSDVATVTYSIARAFRGTLVNNVCTKTKKKKGKKKAKSNCTGYEPVGAFKAPGGAGENARPFSGVLGKKPLSPGGYRATLTAQDSAGSVSDPATVDFTILKAKRAKRRR